MRKNEIILLLEKLNFPKEEFYVLSCASLVLRDLKEEANDLDLCISQELFEIIKKPYSLTEDKKNECGFYHINDTLEVVVNKKDEFKMEKQKDFNLEDLNCILEFKLHRRAPKDLKDIENIKKYLSQN